MLHQNKLKIMELFFEEPSRNFQIREISRITKLAVTSVKNYLAELLEENLIKKDKKTLYPSYISNQEYRLYKVYKKQFIVFNLYSSGLIDFLEDKTYSKCIILFGSVGKGEYDMKSDIDLFVQAKERSINLLKFERKLKHKLNLYFEEDLNKMSSELFNNIINGIKLSGYLKLK